MTQGEMRRNGAALHYEIQGEIGIAPPIVMLHGNGEDSRFFEKQVAAFAKDYAIVLLDSRGHGRSTRGDGKLTIRGIADDALFVLDQLGIAKAHVLGFSDGGNIALGMALADPNRIASLILAGANLNPGGVKLSVQIPTLFVYGLLCAFSPMSAKLRHKRDIVGLMTHDPQIPAKALSALDMPALVMAGERDMIKDAHTRLIAASLPRSELYIQAGGDHFMLAKMPEACNAKIRAFLDKIAEGLTF